MTDTSHIPAVAAALKTSLSAAMNTAFTTPETAVTVYRGRWQRTPDAGHGDYLVLGWSPLDDTISGRQEYIGAGGRFRDENIDAPGYIDVFNGDGDFEAAEDRAFAILAIVEATVRADPQLGGVVRQPGFAELGVYGELPPNFSDTGVVVGVVFHILVNRNRI